MPAASPPRQGQQSNLDLTIPLLCPPLASGCCGCGWRLLADSACLWPWLAAGCCCRCLLACLSHRSLEYQELARRAVEEGRGKARTTAMLQAISTQLGNLTGAAPSGVRAAATAAAASFYDITESGASGAPVAFSQFRGKVVYGVNVASQ
jgi:hypothetical protein